jgi:hypothetical protein
MFFIISTVRVLGGFSVHHQELHIQFYKLLMMGRKIA